MKTCEFNVGGKLCGKRAIHGTSYSDRCRYLCDDHTIGIYADTWRLPLDAETLALLLDQEFTKSSNRPDSGIAMVAGTERILDARDQEYADKTRAILARVAERWNRGEL